MTHQEVIPVAPLTEIDPCAARAATVGRVSAGRLPHPLCRPNLAQLATEGGCRGCAPPSTPPITCSGWRRGGRRDAAWDCGRDRGACGGRAGLGLQVGPWGLGTAHTSPDTHGRPEDSMR